MSKPFFIGILLLMICSSNQTYIMGLQDKGPSNFVDIPAACIAFNSLNNNILNGLIFKHEAVEQVQTLLPEIKNYFYNHYGHGYENSNWIFPVQGYTFNSIGGTNGSGYNALSYDYFDGNKHGGHPAHDIFIVDKNQDSIDDITRKPVNILSMTEGVVIATELAWENTSNLRGGNYIWIYDPNSNNLFYYAHNSNIFVQPGDLVNAGDIIATVGRTGINAFKDRSPTHLHFMQLKLDSNYYPKPFNSYSDLASIMTK